MSYAVFEADPALVNHALRSWPCGLRSGLKEEVMESVSFQVEMRNPNGGREDYWGVTQQYFTTSKEAADCAAEDCPQGWEWRVVRVRLDVVAEGRKAIAA